MYVLLELYDKRKYVFGKFNDVSVRSDVFIDSYGFWIESRVYVIMNGCGG